MYASTIVLVLAGAASIFAAPASDSPVVQAAAAAAAAAPAVPSGSCPQWPGIYGEAGSSYCCVYSGGPTSCCIISNGPNSVYVPEINYTFQSCQSIWFATYNNFVTFSQCNIPGVTPTGPCQGVPQTIGDLTS
ncbi:hypothetical protein COCC4DRAFT_154700 [Bipolaris maydis ATCC 48331]|uniref:Hydrophobin n=2 Tax=Cochliobolus heterostrophus TaxID=5016 RepID=M2SHT0_COCH5|nr:uncharacterized protein COCC4DRAFT_154700 [Bipolaris maydis ATCC 48331]EMD84940.1 hypothetical protein COCHEDRAFT_1161792 [Bipolaris maydis C5]KAH7563593.1 hypothetical protein BM1_00640 [Bipolaris maydis]ENH98867.1 hypothetical protein COCC4DRAFT_154700 [Bipolaris maydis ATCC 48331]KAJ5021271.1 hypothetical protein J3E73DRAFT_403103 [Bipolaris maydis]KAJ5025761.1 hypothetical protein J3E73DRAFT_413963 [Bipolaris maydis]